MEMGKTVSMASEGEEVRDEEVGDGAGHGEWPKKHTDTALFSINHRSRPLPQWSAPEMSKDEENRKLRRDVYDLVFNGRSIDAMRLVKDREQIGIAEAKRWVEGFIMGVLAAREKKS